MSTHAKSIKDGYTGTKYTVTKCPTPVGDETGRVPCKTGQNHVRGTHPYTGSYTGKKRGHGEKVPDARRGRFWARAMENWARAMENWAKPCTRHPPVHGVVHGQKTGTREKSARRPSGTKLGARHGKLGARHGKLGKTMYEAPTRTRGRTRAKNGDTGKKCPTPVGDGSGRAPWKTGRAPWRTGQTHVP